MRTRLLLAAGAGGGLAAAIYVIAAALARQAPPLPPVSSPPLAVTTSPDSFDLLILGGTLVDGTGSPARRADVGIRGDRIVAIGRLAPASPREGEREPARAGPASWPGARRTIDARGLVVAPGFIDMLGHSEHTLLVDSRAVSKLTQGITTEITGEGVSVAPVNERTLADSRDRFAEWGLEVDWRDLDGYFRRLERSLTPINLATFVGATAVRQYVMGDARRSPTLAELRRMVALVDSAMQQGALGLSSALVYAPAYYARTDELIALARAAGERGGLYITHVRNEGSRIRSALREALRIGREAGVPVEIWHLKLQGRANWGRMSEILALLDSARASGQPVGANSYPYTASATGLSAAIPAWAHQGGKDSLLARLRAPATRARLRREMLRASGEHESYAAGAGGTAGILVLSTLDTSLRRYEGRRISEIAAAEGKAPLDALFDLLIADRANTGAAYFSMDERDVRAAIAAPWLTVGSDFGAVAPDGVLGLRKVHPRAYGTFPRILGRYVREERVLSLETAIRKMTGLAAERMGLGQRGLLREGYFADVTVFDPATIADRATFADPHRTSVGVRYVIVNGVLTLDDGRLTAARPGRALRGPGWRGKEESP